MNHYIQLASGLMVRFDGEKYPLRFNEKGFCDIDTVYIQYSSDNWVLCKDFTFHCSNLIADWKTI